jgi:hypothetical protein
VEGEPREAVLRKVKSISIVYEFAVRGRGNRVTPQEPRPEQDARTVVNLQIVEDPGNLIRCPVRQETAATHAWLKTAAIDGHGSSGPMETRREVIDA